MAGRKKLKVDVRSIVLHEAAYKCASPVCRWPVTLDVHHLEELGKGGPDDPANLLPLCPNCHRSHHAGVIPIESLRTWKLLLVTINEAFDRRGVDLLLAIHKLGELALSGGDCAPLIASDLVEVDARSNGPLVTYVVKLNAKGLTFVDGWIAGDLSKTFPA